MKKLIAVFLILTTVITFSACSSNKTKAAANGEFQGETLSVYIWPEYIPDDIIKSFEKTYGVKVQASTYDSNEEMLAKVQNSHAGTYDIVVPSDYMVAYMAQKGMLSKLDKTEISNIKNMNGMYMNQTFDPGNNYSVPFAPGEIIPCYDSKVIKPGTITSLDDLFSNKYKNSLVVLDDMKIVIGLANMSMGYSLNESDPAKLENVRKRLVGFKSNVYTMTFESAQDHIIKGEVPAGYIFNGNVALAEESDPGIKPVWPKEGSYIWIDNMAILKSSSKQKLASTFINYILDPKVDVKIRNEIPSTDPNAAGWKLVDQKLRSCEAMSIPQDQWKKGQFCASLEKSATDIYTKIWAEFTK